MDKRDTLLGSIKELEQLKDSRNEFIENLLAAFERDHPEFIEHLKEADEDEYKHEYLNYYYRKLN